MSTRTRRLLGTAAALAALVLGPATGTPAPAVAAPADQPTALAGADPAPPRVPGRYLAQRLHWAPCDFDLLIRDLEPRAPRTRCADVVVPMDWRHPDDHPDLTVAVALSRATGRSRGLLTLNPGGPGVEGLQATAVFATERPRMFRDFDLLGFDPRGFGRSGTALCRGSQQAALDLPAVADPRVRNPATHRAEVASARYDARACADELNQFVGTQQTVHDLEFVRALLQRGRPVAERARYERLHYVGFSYGTWLGAWYADAYPQHTGRFLLDSNLDWTSTMPASQDLEPASFQRRRDQMFFPWVARHARTYRLGGTAAAVRSRYEKIRAGVLRSHRDGRSPLSATDLDRELVELLYTDADFPLAARTVLEYDELAQPAGDAARAPGELRRLRARAAAPARAAREDDVVWDADVAVRCNDSAWSRDVAAIQRRTDADAARYPFIGYWNALTMCSYWPYPPLTRTVDLAPGPSGAVAPRILMVQSEGDPATGYEGALAAHRATAARTRLVSVQDEGQHGIYLSGVSPCVEAIGDAFLFDGRLPARDTVCGTTPLPRDKTVHPLRGPVTGRPTTPAERPRAARTAGAARAAGSDPRARRAVADLRRAVAAAERR